MSAIDELMAKEDMTKLEKVVHLVYGWDESLCWLAEDAAAELAALRRVAFVKSCSPLWSAFVVSR